MRVEVKPTERPEKLLEYLKDRFRDVKLEEDGLITVETSRPEALSRVPGVEEYTWEEITRDGLGGRPIHRKAFTRIKSRRDAAKAFLATVDGYSLVISSEREWDVRALKKYNSEIVRGDREVAEKLGIEKLEIQPEITDEELLSVYREFLT